MKHAKYLRLGLLLTFTFISVNSFADTVIRSGLSQARLIELYTSEGCSSCPPADVWASNLQEHPALWEQLIPIVFHVDYWDYIGWKDRFAQPEFADRQRRIARENSQATIYTPGLVANGKEWRNFGYAAPGRVVSDDVGALVGHVKDDSVTLRFVPTDDKLADNLVANVALLGFGLESRVRAGENAGRKLSHDFVVLRHATTAMQRNGDRYTASLQRPASNTTAERYALAFWVSNEAELAPLQAAGGWISN